MQRKKYLSNIILAMSVLGDARDLNLVRIFFNESMRNMLYYLSLYSNSVFNS